MIEVVDKKSIKKVNLVVSIFSILMALLILVQQFIVLLRGEVTQNYFISLSVAFILIPIITTIIYRRNPYSTILKRVTAYLYFLFYLIVIFGSRNQMLFIIVTPIQLSTCFILI